MVTDQSGLCGNCFLVYSGRLFGPHTLALYNMIWLACCHLWSITDGVCISVLSNFSILVLRESRQVDYDNGQPGNVQCFFLDTLHGSRPPFLLSTQVYVLISNSWFSPLSEEDVQFSNHNLLRRKTTTATTTEIRFYKVNYISTREPLLLWNRKHPCNIFQPDFEPGSAVRIRCGWKMVGGDWWIGAIQTHLIRRGSWRNSILLYRYTNLIY